MLEECIVVEQSQRLSGEIRLSGAKNAALVSIASLLLVDGKSILQNVPTSEDVFCMIKLLEGLGAKINFDQINKILEVDTTQVRKYQANQEIMKKMRASVLITGPLLARFGRAEIAAPGGCVIGKRPINFHVNNFKKMGVKFVTDGDFLSASVDKLIPKRIVLEYPSVGATENILMAAVLIDGNTSIINAALEPEVLDLITLLKKMGAKINIVPPATIEIEGVTSLSPIEHTVMCDRLEAGSLLIAAAITAGDIYIPDAPAYDMDVFLLKLEEMGHTIIIGDEGKGVRLIGTSSPIAVSFKTAQYPCFPTDLQAPMMVAQCLSEGISEIEETVFENRLVHVNELKKMGAQIKIDGNKATIIGVKELYGTEVIASDIRASCALVLAGLVAKGKTMIKGVHHFRRGYDSLDQKLAFLGAKIGLNIYQSIYQPAIEQSQKSTTIRTE